MSAASFDRIFALTSLILSTFCFLKESSEITWSGIPINVHFSKLNHNWLQDRKAASDSDCFFWFLFNYYFILTKTPAQSTTLQIAHLTQTAPIQSPGYQRKHKPPQCNFVFLSEQMQCTVSIWADWTSLHLLVTLNNSQAKTFLFFADLHILLGKDPSHQGLVIGCEFPGVSKSRWIGLISCMNPSVFDREA